MKLEATPESSGTFVEAESESSSGSTVEQADSDDAVSTSTLKRESVVASMVIRPDVMLETPLQSFGTIV